MKAVIWIIVVIIVIVGGWYFVSPLFLDTAVDEDFPEVSAPHIPTPEELAAMDQQQLNEIRNETMEQAAGIPDKVMEDVMPDVTEPVLLQSGSFVGADSFHQGSGTAGVYDLSSGEHVLRLEDFSVTNGPDLRVLLSTQPNPTAPLAEAEYIELGKLKGNKGNQNYNIPQDIDVSLYNSVIIYCKPFHVLFASASLN